MLKNYNSALQSNNADLQAILSTINNLPTAGGVNLPVLTNEGSSNDLILGKELVNTNGQVVTGTMPNNGAIISTMDGINIKSIAIPSGYTSGGTVSLDNTIDNEVDTQSDLITQIKNVINTLPEAGGSAPTLQDKTVTPTTSKQTITADNGYDGLDVVTVNAIPSNYIIPSGTLTISINGTHNVKNYESAVVNVAGSGGVGGEDSETLEALLNCTITNYSNNELSKVRTGLFADCSNLTTVSLPNCTDLADYAFYSCKKLNSVNLPICKRALKQAFAYCTDLTNINLPLCSSFATYVFSACTNLETASLPELSYVGAYAFSDCNKLTTLSLPKGNNIGGGAFSKCFNLKSLYLMSTSVCKLQNSNAFTSTPIGGYSTSAGTYGSIYVPASLVDTYKASTNWTYFSSRFVGV